MKRLTYEDIKDKTVVELIKMSIEKWKDIRDEKGSDLKQQNCALCKRYRSYTFTNIYLTKGVLINERLYNTLIDPLIDTLLEDYLESNNPYCVGCPVREKTGDHSCLGTPYVHYNAIFQYSPNDTSKRKELQKTAQEEIEFLEGLITYWEENDSKCLFIPFK